MNATGSSPKSLTAKTVEQENREDRIMRRIFLSPAVLILLALSIFPLIWALGIGFTDMQRGGSTTARIEQAAGQTGGGFLGMDFSLTSRNYDTI